MPQNPLAFGPNVATRSDARVFNADGGTLIHKMAASNGFFLSTCAAIIERMINTVPSSVKLSSPIDYLYVKPSNLTADINDDGSLALSGIIRVNPSLVFFLSHVMTEQNHTIPH